MKTPTKRGIKNGPIDDIENIPKQNWDDLDAPINHNPGEPEPEPEPIPEISAELDDLTAEDKKVIDDPNVPAPEIKKSDIELSREAAAGSLLIVKNTLVVFGIDIGLTDEQAQEWAAGVAPCMAKYNLIPSMGGEKWKAEMAAIKATAALGFGMFLASKAKKAEPEPEPKKKTSTELADGPEPELSGVYSGD